MIAPTQSVLGGAPVEAEQAEEITTPLVSVVMPCLNEEATIGRCVAKAWRGIELAGVPGEVIVADNGSTDRSPQIAAAAGARVVHQPKRGYGSAYLAAAASAG